MRRKGKEQVQTELEHIMLEDLDSELLNKKPCNVKTFFTQY